ncbi:MAG: polyphenol oxidase family protein, partial [Actinomycetota bacterium]|nr:polyphenol oxidase family protein [Actinomycetota bacterium]
PEQGVVGVAHAGRAGLRAGIVPAVVAAMRRLGATGLVARVGPSICGRCYEVPARMCEDVSAAIPQARSVTARGTPGLDIAAGACAQLETAGVAVRRVAGCTAEDARWYSYRRDGTTGRFAGLAWRRP